MSNERRGALPSVPPLYLICLHSPFPSEDALSAVSLGTMSGIYRCVWKEDNKEGDGSNKVRSKRRKR